MAGYPMNWNEVGRYQDGNLISRLAEAGRSLGGIVTIPVGILYDVSRTVTPDSPDIG